MATPALQGEIWEVTTEGTQEGQQVMNVWHFRCDTNVDDIEGRLLRALMECFLTNLIPVMASTFQLTRVHGKRVFPDLGPIIENVPLGTDTVQGAAVGDAAPSFVSICANIHSTRGGRSGRGRKFLMAVPESSTQGSFIPPDNAFWLAVLAFALCVADKFIHTGEPLGDNRISLGVFSRKLGVTIVANAPDIYHAEGFAPATVIKPIARISHNVSRRVGRGS